MLDLELSEQEQIDHVRVVPQIEPEDELKLEHEFGEDQTLRALRTNEPAASHLVYTCLLLGVHASSVHGDIAVAETFILVIEDISISLKFIENVKNTSLKDYLDEDAIYEL